MLGQKTDRIWRIMNNLNNQITALATLLIIAVWGVLILWIDTRNPYGMDPLEFTFMGTLSILFWVHVPLFWKRVSWSYLTNIGLIVGGFGGGLGIAMLNRTLHISFSLYNVTSLIIYMISFLGVIFSIRAFRELK